MTWEVKTVSGAAGGLFPAVATLQVTTEANTVEDIRRKVESLPELLEACRSLVEQFGAYRNNWRGDTTNGWIDRVGLAADLEKAESAIRKATT